MIQTFQRIQRRRVAGEIDEGFTLIELLIVIVVLGILAAIVVFALGGVTGKSSAAACQSDAKTVGVGVSALMAENPAFTGTGQLVAGTGTGAATTAGGWEWALTSTGTTLVSGESGTVPYPLTGNPFVQSWPSSSSYTVSVSDGSSGNVYPLPTGTPPVAGTAQTAPWGDVLVTGTNTSTTALNGVTYAYDATVNPIEACNWAVLGHA